MKIADFQDFPADPMPENIDQNTGQFDVALIHSFGGVIWWIYLRPSRVVSSLTTLDYALGTLTLLQEIFWHNGLFFLASITTSNSFLRTRWKKSWNICTSLGLRETLSVRALENQSRTVTIVEKYKNSSSLNYLLLESNSKFQNPQNPETE